MIRKFRKMSDAELIGLFTFVRPDGPRRSKAKERRWNAWCREVLRRGIVVYTDWYTKKIYFNGKTPKQWRNT